MELRADFPPRELAFLRVDFAAVRWLFILRVLPDVDLPHELFAAELPWRAVEAHLALAVAHSLT